MYCFRNLEMLFICRFDQCAISPLSLKAVKDAGYERMTQVQEATLPVILQGQGNGNVIVPSPVNDTSIFWWES